MSAEATSTDVQTVAPQVIESKTPQIKLIDHFMEYPLINSAVNSAAGVPYPKNLVSMVAPTIGSIRNSTPIKQIMDVGDLATDAALRQVDRMVPQLKTIETVDVTDSLRHPMSSATSGIQRATESIDLCVVQPARKVAQDARETFATVIYDNNGKAIIRSRADPLVAPFNDRLESLIGIYCPDLESVSKDGFSNELSRTCRIVGNTLTGTRPFVEKELGDVSILPETAMSHVQQVVQDASEHTSNPIVTGLEIGRTLTHEFVASVFLCDDGEASTKEIPPQSLNPLDEEEQEASTSYS